MNHLMNIKFKKKLITSWYSAPENTYQPNEVVAEPDQNKEQAYSWVKAARYNNLPFEVGPLARLILSGAYDNGISAMDRTIARALRSQENYPNHEKIITRNYSW